MVDPTRVTIIQWLLALLCFIAPFSLLAQDEDGGDYQFPDIPERWADVSKYRNEHFSVGMVFVGLFDYSVFDQNRRSIDQVGEQDNAFDARSFRFLVAGTLDFIGPWSYLISVEYNGLDDTPGDPTFKFIDVAMTRHFADGTRRLTFGKQKQPFIYELAGDAANLPHHERLLNPFFVSRAWGISYTHTYLEKRLALQAGWFNDWFVASGDFKAQGNQFTARLTGLPVWQDEGSRFLHLGVSLRYQEDEQGFLRYVGRPGSNVTDYYVDTGSFGADHAWNLGLEALWQSDRFTVLGEYVQARVKADTVGNPGFDGYYVTASYLFNGELRPYDTMKRFSRRVEPEAGWGTFEPFVRIGRVNLDDTGISGGRMQKWYVGVNWWATRRWKMSAGYGDIELDRYGTTGLTKQVLFRLQWIGP